MSENDNFNENTNELTNPISETAIIGLPRLETILDDINQPVKIKVKGEVSEETSLTDTIPVSILETYQTQPLDEADINLILNEVEAEKTVEKIDLKPPKKRRRKRHAKRNNLILPGKEIEEPEEEKVIIKVLEPEEETGIVKIKVFGPLAHINHETIATQEGIEDQLEYDEVILKEYSREEFTKTQVAPDISGFFEEEEKLKTLITPNKKAKKRRRKHHQVTTETRELSPTQTNLIPTPEISLEEEGYIFSNVPEHLVRAGLILYNNLTRQMQKDGALRVEHLMTVLGSLAGYSAQEGTREKMINRLKLQEDQVFSIIETVDGSKYYFSDTIDRTLQKDKHSIWYMSATAALKLTGKVNCNINEIVSYNIRNLGKKGFGIPRITKNLRSGNLPEYYVKHLWIPIQKGLERFTDNPLDWPIIFGVALQRALIVTKDVLDPNVSLKIAMESAVPTSIMDVQPINPNEVPEKEDNKLLIEKLRREIQIIRKSLEIPGMPEEQRESLLAELSDKNEQLFLLLS